MAPASIASHVVLAATTGSDPLIPDAGELILGVIAFAILAATLMKVVFPMIEKSYTARRDAIEGGIARAESEQAKAHAAYEAYTAQLADAQQEAARYREEARADAVRIRADANEQALTEAARVTKAAEDRLAAERAGIVAELRAELGGLAVDLAGRIVGHVLESDAEQDRIVEQFLGELESGEGIAAPGAVTTSVHGTPSGAAPTAAPTVAPGTA